MNDDYQTVMDLCSCLSFAAGYMGKKHPEEAADFGRAIRRGTDLLTKLGRESMIKPNTTHEETRPSEQKRAYASLMDQAKAAVREVSCPHCHGTGLIAHPKVCEQCTTCNGSGRVRQVELPERKLPVTIIKEEICNEMFEMYPSEQRCKLPKDHDSHLPEPQCIHSSGEKAWRILTRLDADNFQRVEEVDLPDMPKPPEEIMALHDAQYDSMPEQWKEEHPRDEKYWRDKLLSSFRYTLTVESDLLEERKKLTEYRREFDSEYTRVVQQRDEAWQEMYAVRNTQWKIEARAEAAETALAEKTAEVQRLTELVTEHEVEQAKLLKEVWDAHRIITNLVIAKRPPTEKEIEYAMQLEKELENELKGEV